MKITLPQLRTISFLLIFSLCGVLPAWAEEPTDAAMKSLASTSVFALGGVGLAGRTSQGELGFRVISSLPSRDALAHFEQVYLTGNAQAKAYALLGIHKLDIKKFQELLRSLSDANADVTTMHGCIMDREKFFKIAKRIEQGKPI